MSHRTSYTIEGLDCAVCATKVENAVKSIKGVNSSQLDFVNKRLDVITEKEVDSSFIDHLSTVVKKEEPQATLLQREKIAATRHRHNYNYSIVGRVAIALILLFIGRQINYGFSLALFLAAYIISGYDVLLRALKNIFKGKVFDEHFLMTIATVGAFAIGDFSEAVAVMAFYQMGEFVQGLAVERSRVAISNLIDITPQQATLIKDGVHSVVPLSEIEVGDTLLITAGEKVAVDAKVTKGESTVDTKAITGEANPVFVTVGDSLLSGTINGSGPLTAVATTTYQDSTVAIMLRLVEEASFKKAKTERFISKFARIYTPIVVFLALAVALIPPTLGLGPFSMWLYRALIFLVISCPCALVISVPLGFFGGIGGLSRLGVLVKGGNYLQALAKAEKVVLDKTGTLTKGVFSVTEVTSFDSRYSKEEIVSYASSLERHSSHPIAVAVSQHQNEYYEATEVNEILGKGIEGLVESTKVRVGSQRFIEEELKRKLQISEAGGTTLYVALDNSVIGSITLGDTVKKEAQKMLTELQNVGVKDVTILSGDTERAVAEAATPLGITSFKGGLLPQDKVAYVEEALLQKSKKGSLIFVGDGINDSPVLARSDVGIAMGGIGSDAAIEASDVVIMSDDLVKIPQAISHSKRTLSIVKQNITLALTVKVAVMILGAVGLASMWMAVFADTGVALLAILNSLRALNYKK